MVSLWKCSGTLVFSFLFGLNISFAETTAPDLKFGKEKIQVGTKNLTVEVARAETEQEHGLMFRKKMGLDEGMLFIFKTEQFLYFWMKNTPIDLSIGYFDKDGVLIDIQEMKAVLSVIEDKLPNYPSKKPSLYALEMNSHWFAKNKIKLGTKLKFLKDRR